MLVKIVTWVESGGVRCIGLTYAEQDIERYIKISHCAVFCDIVRSDNSGDSLYKKCISKFMELASK